MPVAALAGTKTFIGPALSAMKFGTIRPGTDAAFKIGRR